MKRCGSAWRFPCQCKEVQGCEHVNRQIGLSVRSCRESGGYVQWNRSIHDRISAEIRSRPVRNRGKVSGRVVGYGPNATLRHMKQIPSQNEGRAEGSLRHKALPYAPDGWHGLEPVKASHEASFNRRFHKLQPMRAVERKPGGLLRGILDGRRPSMATRMRTS